MSVSYNSKYIIPAPFLNLQKNYTRTEDMGKVNPLYKLVLTGKMLPCKGSPSASGSWWTTTGYPPDDGTTDSFNSLLNKQEAMRHLFADDGRLFEVKSDSTALISCYPTIDNVQFTEGHWYTYIDYSIEMTATRISGLLANEHDLKNNDYGQHLASVRETWNLEQTDEHEGIELAPIYNLTHNIGAVGYTTYTGSGILHRGWEEAKEWVGPRLGLDYTKLTGTSGIGLPSYYSGFNYKRSEETDEVGGAYNVVETWTITSGNVIEEFAVNIRVPSDSYIVSVTAEGSIRGLETSGNYSSTNNRKWDNASYKYGQLDNGGLVTTIYDRAQTYSGYSSLNPTPLSKTIAKNPVAGVINYTYEYDTRPTNYVSGAIYESINIQDTYTADVFGSIMVPGRANGPVLQDMGTVTSPKKAINIDVIMPYYSGASLANAAGFTALFAASPVTQVDEIVVAFNTYLTGAYDQVFVDNSTDSWDIKTGHYQRNVSWTLGDCT